MDIPTASEQQEILFPVSRGNRREDLANAIRFFLPRSLNELIHELYHAISGELNRLRYLGPLRSYPPRHLAFSQHHDPNWIAGGGYAWDTVRTDASVRRAVNEWLGAKRLQTPYELVVRELVSLDDLEGPIWEALENLELDIEPDSEELHATPVIKEFETEVTRFQELIQSADIDRLQELILFDGLAETPVSHRDVGIGISQVLPVLVSAYASKNQIVAIEQPEIHLHPGLQAELGDVFIESALGEKRNTFLIETHSEHLILRLLRRIRETTDRERNANLLPISPDDIAVIYAEPGREGTKLTELRATEDGDFMDDWPHGFFTEREEELFGK